MTNERLKELSRFIAVEITGWIVDPGYYFPDQYPQRVTKGEKWINPKSKRDFPAIFERNYNEFLIDNPGTSPEQYRQYAKQYLTQLIEAIEKQDSGVKKLGNYRWAKRFLDEYLINGIGFETRLTRQQLKYLYSEMKPYCATSQANFIAALTPRPLPPGFERVRWIDKNKQSQYSGQPSKTKLRAFLEWITDRATLRDRDVKRCFADPSGQPISLGKPKRDVKIFDKYKAIFEKMI